MDLSKFATTIICCTASLIATLFLIASGLKEKLKEIKDAIEKQGK